MRLTFVPLDDRPCTAAFPQRLAPLGGLTLSLPPPDLLGTCTTFGQAEQLLGWLEQEPPSRPLLLSSDMVLYGGLVASRAQEPGAAVLQARAERVENWLRRRQGAGPAEAFTILMRVPPYLTSETERQFSEVLQAWSQAVASGHDTRRRQLEATLPLDYRTRYLATRTRNADVNRRVLAWAEQGLLDYALVGMDDSRTEGVNVQERSRLEPVVATLFPRAALIPGADEIGVLLLARHALEAAGRRPRVCVRYSPSAFEQAVTRYEDRPVGRLVEAHLGVLGVAVTPCAEEADLLLLVNGCAGRQREASVQVLPPRVTARLRALSSEAEQAMERGQLVAVADLAYANGADRGLVEALARQVDLPSLAAFAGWNTAGNTVGTVLAHAALRWLSLRHPASHTDAREATAAHVGFLFERLVDDWAYQSVVRRQVGTRCALRGQNVHSLGEAHAAVEASVQETLADLALPLFARAFAGTKVEGPGGACFRVGGAAALATHLPWHRLFEVAVEATVPLEIA